MNSINIFYFLFISSVHSIFIELNLHDSLSSREKWNSQINLSISKNVCREYEKYCNSSFVEHFCNGIDYNIIIHNNTLFDTKIYNFIFQVYSDRVGKNPLNEIKCMFHTFYEKIHEIFGYKNNTKAAIFFGSNSASIYIPGDVLHPPDENIISMIDDKSLSTQKNILLLCTTTISSSSSVINIKVIYITLILFHI